MLKKAGVAVGIAAAALVALSPLAFADEDGSAYGGSGEHFQIPFGVQDHVFQHPVKECNHHYAEGKAGFFNKDQSNTDSHDGDCDQDISPSPED